MTTDDRDCDPLTWIILYDWLHEVGYAIRGRDLQFGVVVGQEVHDFVEDVVVVHDVGFGGVSVGDAGQYAECLGGGGGGVIVGSNEVTWAITEGLVLQVINL